MEKKYEPLEIELIYVNNSDVITSSPGTETPPIEDDADPFKGGYDPNGWT